jgi:cell division transport system permease protein
LFGSFSIGWTGYLGTIAVAAFVAVLTAETTRITVIRHLHGLDKTRAD